VGSTSQTAESGPAGIFRPFRTDRQQAASGIVPRGNLAKHRETLQVNLTGVSSQIAFRAEVLLLRFANLHHGQLEEGRLMLQRLGLNEQIPEVVGHHPFRAMLCGIDTHDGELLTAHLLHARRNDTTGLLHILRVARI